MRARVKVSGPSFTYSRWAIGATWAARGVRKWGVQNRPPHPASTQRHDVGPWGRHGPCGGCQRAAFGGIGPGKRGSSIMASRDNLEDENGARRSAGGSMPPRECWHPPGEFGGRRILRNNSRRVPRRRAKFIALLGTYPPIYRRTGMVTSHDGCGRQPWRVGSVGRGLRRRLGPRCA